MFSSRGQMMPMVIAILFGFMIIMFVTTFYLRQESIWTVKEKKSTTAFHLAEAGIDRAVWKLNETRSGWGDAVRGIIPSLYDGTTTFYEQDKGYYKIRISSAKVGGEEQVIIHSVGTDEMKREVRGLKMVHVRRYVDSAIKSINGLSFSGNADVHWGPVMNSKGDVEMDTEYPRKYAGPGYIVDGRDPDGLGGEVMGPAAGAYGDNTPELDEEYKDWSSEGSRPIADVDIKLSDYLAKATSYVTPTDAPDRDKAVPPNSGYYPSSAGNITFPTQYTDFCSTAAYYIEGNAKLSQNVFIGPPDGKTKSQVSMIVLGNLELPNGSGTSASGDNYLVYVPTGAWKEYQVFDTDAIDEYPADTGFRDNPSEYDVNGHFKSGPGKVVFHGLVYVGIDLDTSSGNKKIVGVAIVRGEVEQQSGTLTYYYSKVVDENITFTGIKFRQNYWAEFVPGSFDNPDW